MSTRRHAALLALGSTLVAGFAHKTPWASERSRSVIELSANALTDLPKDLKIAFCALDMAEDSIVVLDESDVDQRQAPWSTFKIPNLIIALETGVANDLAHWRDWDRRHRPAAHYWPPAWKQGHSLASAFKQSVVWYFQDIALDVGTMRYRKDLLRFGYGNASVPMHSDGFWLGGPLIISPREQTYFLKRVLDGSLAISDRTSDMLREVSLIKSAGDYALHGKTGSGRLEGSGFEGWFVGWVERARTPIATFALHLRAPDFQSLQDARLDAAEKLLRTAGYLPQDWK